LGQQSVEPENFSLPTKDFAPDSKGQFANTRSTAEYLHAAPDPRSVEFLTVACRRLANSTPFGTSIKLTGHLFGQNTAATGQYFQMGQGTHRSRLELEFDAGDAIANSFQLCDGRFVYRLQTFGGQQQFDFVDLNRFAEQTNTNATFSPSSWIATGGMASLLEQFNQSFNFGSPKQIRHTLGNQASLVFPSEPKIRSRNAIPWDKIPKQLPHGIEVVFDNNALLGMFPRKIHYLKFAPNPDGGAMRLKPMMTLEFSRPVETDQLAENMFIVRSSDIESVDTTDQYLAQVKTILAKRQAEKKTNNLQQLK